MARHFSADAPWGSISARDGHGDDSSASAAYGCENDDEDEVDLPAWEYARLCGFCTDFLLENPLHTCATSLLPVGDETFLADLHRALGLENVSVNDLVRERISCNKDGADLLRRVVTQDDKHNPLEFLPEPVLKPSMKMELPLLRTDHGMDMRSFTRTTEVSLCELNLPIEHVNVEEDEGFEWPQKFLQLPKTILDDIGNARLECGREAVTYLQELLIEPTTSDELDHIYDEIKPYVRPNNARLVTPPLLPALSPPLQPFDPSSETGQLPLLSDSTDSIASEVAILDRQFQCQDRIHALDLERAENCGAVDTDEITQIYPPLQSDLRTDDESLLPHKRKRDELMIEVPIVASDSNSSDTSKKMKTVSFAEQLRTIIPDLPCPHPSEGPNSESEESMEAFFDEVLDPLAQAAREATEREQLIAADCMQRVEVPAMDFALPLPPWKVSNICFTARAKSVQSVPDEWAKVIGEIKHTTMTASDYGNWKLSGRSERQLHPYPFRAELGKVPKEQGIDDSRYIAVIMSDMSLENVVTSDTLVWKPEGLRVLHRMEIEYDEDELEDVGTSIEDTYEGEDIDTLVRKRHRELGLVQEPGKYVHPATVSPSLVRCTSGTVEAPIAMMSQPTHMELAAVPIQPSNRFFAGQFSTAGELHKFMQSMGQEVKRSRTEDCVNRQPPGPKISSEPTLRTDAVQTQVADIKTVDEPNKIVHHFALPPLRTRLPHRSVILSMTIVQAHRQLVRTVFQELYPSAKYVERDFSLLQNTPEADILLSPGTGLVVSSLQKIKQKSLPGQGKQLTGVRDHIKSLETRYEMLIVLVSDAMMLDTENIDPRDGEAIADFTAFCSTFKIEIQIRYVPAGDSNLAVWVAACICEYGDNGQDMSLLQEETVWEQVLRRAGLNAYAAQSVLASLKADVLSSSSDPSPDMSIANPGDDFGIRAFVRMTHEERILRFEGLLKGRAVLQRVSRTLDSQWLSAMTGFR